MPAREHDHGPAPRFDSLFGHPRHYRSDCRLVRTAIRRGWLADAPQAVRDALLARMERAMDERKARDPEGKDGRALLAEIWMMMEPVRAQFEGECRDARAWWAERLGASGIGRPRERWHVSDYRNRIDANELRRRAIAEGLDLSVLGWIIVRTTDDPGDPGERIGLEVVADRRYGSRFWLRCPRCGQRRAHLYPTRPGALCRRCAGVGYRPALRGLREASTQHVASPTPTTMPT